MMLVWLPRALADRDAHLDVIATDKPTAVILAGDQIMQQASMLVTHPELGRDGRKKGTREVVISRTPFILVYRFNARAARIEILRLLHGAQKYLDAG